MIIDPFSPEHRFQKKAAESILDSLKNAWSSGSVNITVPVPSTADSYSLYRPPYG